MRPLTNAGWTSAAAALISFSRLGTARSRQDNPTVTLIEGEQMHRRLSLARMSERSAYGFAIHRHLGERLFLFVRLQAAGFAPTLFHGSCFQQHAGDHRDELLRIAAR